MKKPIVTTLCAVALVMPLVVLLSWCAQPRVPDEILKLNTTPSEETLTNIANLSTCTNNHITHADLLAFTHTVVDFTYDAIERGADRDLIHRIVEENSVGGAK